MKPLFRTKSADMPKFGPKIGLGQTHKIHRFIARHLQNCWKLGGHWKGEERCYLLNLGKGKYAWISSYIILLWYVNTVYIMLMVYLTGVFEDSKPREVLVAHFDLSNDLWRGDRTGKTGHPIAGSLLQNAVVLAHMPLILPTLIIRLSKIQKHWNHWKTLRRFWLTNQATMTQIHPKTCQSCLAMNFTPGMFLAAKIHRWKFTWNYSLQIRGL